MISRDLSFFFCQNLPKEDYFDLIKRFEHYQKFSTKIKEIYNLFFKVNHSFKLFLPHNRDVCRQGIKIFFEIIKIG